MKMPMPIIRGLLETALYVEDLERAADFYERLFGFARLYAEPRLIALAIPGRQVLLLFLKGASSGRNVVPGGVIPPHDGFGRLHLAFAIDPSQRTAWRDALTAAGIALESEVIGDRGGHSLYFRDPDQNLVELATPGLWEIY